MGGGLLKMLHPVEIYFKLIYYTVNMHRGNLGEEVSRSSRISFRDCRASVNIF